MPAELGNLVNLWLLNLRGNQLSGEIPSELGATRQPENGCTSTATRLSGEIPSELGRLANLESLELGDNQLTREIPSELGDLANLEVLFLYRNQLGGEIPSELGDLPNLESLSLYRNQLSGEIPAELGQLINLESLDLSDNQLSGEIPSALGSLASLESLSLSANRLSGEIPPELGDLASLRSLSLRANQLSGEIPSELGSLANLQWLWLIGNQLSGEIPSELGDLPNLEALYLDGNRLSGEIPSELGDLASLRALWLSSNQLSGEIPAELGQLASLEWLFLSSNRLSGEIPSELGDLASLEYLLLSDNRLSGEIPPELGDLASLRQLNLSDNQLRGEIPSELGALANLDSLSLSRNQLSGEIPSELGSLANLEWLRLSGNQLTGCIPEGLRDVENNDLHRLGLPFCGDTPGLTPADPCGQTLTGDGTVSGQWAAGCESEQRDGRHARYYSFTLDQQSEVTVTLESSEADTYLYLRQGEARSGDFLAENDDHEGSTSRSIVAQTLAAGSYTIEATTYGGGETGSFTLTIAGLGTTTTPGPEPSDPCGQTISGDGTVSGQWAAGCESEQRDGRHARYYTFALAQQSEVTITLESGDADTYLYLRAGELRSGDYLHQNDDHEGSTSKSLIAQTLAAGTYTIEATTYSEGETGSFTLTVAGLEDTGATPGPEPTDECGQTLSGDGTVSGQWAAGCESEQRDGRHARYYSFALDQESEVTITLESDDADTYLYLRAGEARSGAFLHENDDHEDSTEISQIQESLPAGTYTIEATTYDAGETGSFTLTVAGLETAAGPTPSVPALWFDTESAPFDDPRVRFAISYAIDQELINEIFLDGRGDLQSPVPDALFPQWTTELDDPVALQEWHLYDLGESRRLLAEAGYADGFETRVHVPPRWAQWAEVIAEMLAEVDIAVDVVISDPALVAALGQVSHQAMIFAPLQGFGGDVAAFIREHFTDEGQHNYSRLASDVPEEILSEFVGTEDPERRRELVYNLQNYLH